MSKLFELQERRSRLVAEMRSIAERPEGQGGDLSEGQERRFIEAKTEVASIEKAIERQSFLDDQDRRAAGTPVGERREGQERPEVRAGQFLQHVANVGTPGGRGLETRAYGQSEGVGSEGGYLVQSDFSTLLLAGVQGASQLLPMCTRVPLSAGANAIDLPVVDESSRADSYRHGGALAYWLAEGAEITKSAVKFRNLSLKLGKLGSLYYASDELIQDAPALGSVLSNYFAAELGFSVDLAILNGTGAGQPLGILQSPALVSVAKETGQDADSIVYENVLKLWARMWPRGRGKAAWLIGPGVEPQLQQMYIGLGTAGQPVYLPPNGLAGQPYGTIFGRPVIPCEQLPAVGDKGDIVLADLSQYVVAEKGGPQGQSSIHVRFAYDETAYRVVWRLMGQPAWNAAMSPYSGSDQISPFVCLDERA